VHGLAITGAAVARALHRRGEEVILSDDAASGPVREAAVALADELGVELVAAPLVDTARVDTARVGSAASGGAVVDQRTIDRLVGSIDEVVPAPGVPETHPLVVAALARGVGVVSELDLATRWEAERPGGPRPMIGITGTDGKTTTTELVATLLRGGGVGTAAVGNTDVPLVAALDDPAMSAGIEVFTVECSSFRLAFTEQFRPIAGIWLNLAPDHLNWHHSFDSYELAKARLWAHQRPDDVAIGWFDDVVVQRHLARARARRRTFGLAADADYHVVGAPPVDGEPDRRELVGPNGPLASVASMRRRFPHDLSNALAACAAVVEAGFVGVDTLDASLAEFRTPPHRIEPLGTIDGVAWFDDSKATSPHAALTAIRSFDSLVLIAGGKNKDLDLSALAGEAHRIRHVVATGAAADEVGRVFAGVVPVSFARVDMREAAELAASAARPGDAVLLSPACTSFDWYSNYVERGLDFQRIVADRARAAEGLAWQGGGAA
jgi:UDP-N-acetylmuramoylalanine--D-glutamate ligase